MKGICDRARAYFVKHPAMISIGYMCIYFPIFTLLEQFREPQYFIHCALDDVIPFNEWFLIPYFMWFAFVPGLVAYMYFHSRDDYFKVCKVIYGGMSVCLLIYFLFPTGLMLREPVEGDNVLCELVNMLRQIDTPTNVCPSIHVSSTVGILLVIMKSEKLKEHHFLKVSMLILGSLICVSTTVLDQHSVVDVVCGMLLSTALYYLVELSAQPAVQKSNEKLWRF